MLPSATVAVDTVGDGVADTAVTGVDLNRDGIPDALQGPRFGPYGAPFGACYPPPFAPAPYGAPYANLLAADKNKDGVIDPAEYVDAVRTGKLPGAAYGGYPGYGGFPGYGFRGYPGYAPGYGTYPGMLPPYGGVPYGNLLAADKNKDGVIDPSEYVDAVRTGTLPGAAYGYRGPAFARGLPGVAGPPPGLSPEHRAKWDHYYRMYSSQLRGGPAVPLGNLLAADTNGDGVIDGAEYVDAVRTGKLPPAGYPGYSGYRGYPPFMGYPPVAGAGVPYGNLLAADKNKDGVIDPSEYVDAVKTGTLPGLYAPRYVTHIHPALLAEGAKATGQKVEPEQAPAKTA